MIFRVILHDSRSRHSHPQDTSKAPRTGPFLMGKIAHLSRNFAKVLTFCRFCGPTRTTSQSVAECHKGYYIFNNTYNNGLFRLPWNSPTLPAPFFLSRIRRARFLRKIRKSSEIFRRFSEKFSLGFVVVESINKASMRMVTDQYEYETVKKQLDLDGHNTGEIYSGVDGSEFIICFAEDWD